MSSDGVPSSSFDSVGSKLSKAEKTKQRKINKAHPEFELTYDMMLGIRTVVGKTEAQAHKSLTPADFEATIKLKFPGKGSAITPAHQMRDFKFKDYSPEVFRMIREKFNINPADYLMCVCGNFQYLEFISNSKSGQFFFYTHDRKYMIKTVTQSECKFLRKILPAYYAHIAQNPQTLLTRFYGVHRVKPHKKRERHFLIMGSVFYTSKYIHTVFDLKGSTQGRSATEEDKKSSACIFKDLDLLDQKIELKIGQPRADILNSQIAKDVDFLRQLNIMDYSLLLGIHYRDRLGKPGRDNQENNVASPAKFSPNPDSGLEMNEIQLENSEFSTEAETKVEEEKKNVNDEMFQSRMTRAYTAVLPNSGSSSMFFHRPPVSQIEIATESPTLEPFPAAPIDSINLSITQTEPAKLSDQSNRTGQSISNNSPADPAIHPQSNSADNFPSTPTTPVHGRENLTASESQISSPADAPIDSSAAARSPRLARSNTVIDIPTFERSPTSGKAIKRQSQYGLPKHWNVTSKPSDISFNAPEFEPIVIQTPRPQRTQPDTPELGSLVKEEEKEKPIAIEKLIFDGQLVFDAGGLAGLTDAGQLSNEIYFMGIIDILSIYGMKKRMETIAKSLKYSSSEISAVNPNAYGERFKKFLAMAIK